MKALLRKVLRPGLVRNAQHINRTIASRRAMHVQLKAKTVCFVRRLAGARGALYFYPLPPAPWTTPIYRICHTLGVTMRHGKSRDHPSIYWPHHDGPTTFKRKQLINGSCTNINKTEVMRAFEQVFAYGYSVDPLTTDTPYVRKSDINFRHDGAILTRPKIPEAGFVYQRLLDNRSSAEAVEDIRLIYIDGLTRFAYRKLRPIDSRFSNVNASVELVPLDVVTTKDEQTKTRRLCLLMALEYGELDTVRDRSDGKLYILDVNRTPGGPPNGLSDRDEKRAVQHMADTFSATFL